MAVEKACRMCRYVSTGAETCPACGSSDLTDQWTGFIIVTNVESSEMAKVLSAKMAGKYAVRIK
ncbi:MAG: transcription elongation factor subunit Spt4 [Candidatus Micrarchaeia archaeon]